MDQLCRDRQAIKAKNLHIPEDVGTAKAGKDPT
jgi:hypothetical protein